MIRPHPWAAIPGTKRRDVQKGSPQQDAVQPVPLRDRELLHRAEVLNAGVVDQDLNRPQLS